MSKTEVKGPGRPSVVGKVINTHIVQLRNKTPLEFVEYIFPKVQGLMKGGVTTDSATIKKQKVSLYQGVLRKSHEAIEAGKRVSFQGRKVGSEIKMKWIHSEKVEKV